MWTSAICPSRIPTAILAEVGGLSGARVISTFSRPPGAGRPGVGLRAGALAAAATQHSAGQVRGVVGRDGASDAVSFLRAGVPAVEFGPVGDGHHGPDEWVSMSSLAGYRRSIVDFVNELPSALAADAARRRGRGLTADGRDRAARTERTSRTSGSPGAARRRSRSRRRRRRAAEPPPSPPPATWAGAGGADEPSASSTTRTLRERAGRGARRRRTARTDPPAEACDDEPAATRARPRGQDTVEADTPALADREAAREAALAGLRARTAEHAAKQRGRRRPAGSRRPAAVGRPPRPAGQSPSPRGRGRSRAEPKAAPPADGGLRRPADQAEESRRRAGPVGAVRRRLALIVVSMATATAVSLLVYLNDIAQRPRRPAFGSQTSSRWPTRASPRRSSSWAPTSVPRGRRSARGRTPRSCCGSPPTRSRCCRSPAT